MYFYFMRVYVPFVDEELNADTDQKALWQRRQEAEMMQYQNIFLSHLREHGDETIDAYSIEKNVYIDTTTLHKDHKLSERVGLNMMFRKAVEGDTIVVIDTSHLWRSKVTEALIKMILSEKKLALFVVRIDDFVDVGKNSAEITELQHAMVEWNKLATVFSLEKGRIDKARKGIRSSGALPYGYYREKGTKAIAIDNAKAAVVKEVFSMVYKGISLAKIASQLNERRIETNRRGGKWTPQSLSAMVKNDFYYGEVVYSDSTYWGSHEPLFSKAYFTKANKKLRSRNKKKQPNTASEPKG